MKSHNREDRMDFVKKTCYVLFRLIGVILISLGVCVGLTFLYRLLFSGMNDKEYLVIGLSGIAIEAAIAFLSFRGIGYEQRKESKKLFGIQLFCCGMIHFLLSLPFHFSMYISGPSVTMLTKYFYLLRYPECAGPTFSFSEIPFIWFVGVFLFVEVTVLLVGYLGYIRGRTRRKKESDAFLSQATNQSQ